MNKSILVITDKTDCNWLDIAIGNGENHYDLLTLGLNAEGIAYANKDKFDRVKSLNIIDINKYAESAQEKIRTFIPDFIYEFPRKHLNGQSILKLFRLKSIDFWWFNRMSEKGAWGTPLIKRMYYLELIRNVTLEQEYQEIWAEIEDVSILKLLKTNRRRLYQIKIIGNHRKEKPMNGANFWLRLFKNVFLVQGFYLCRFLLLKLLMPKEIVKREQHSILFFTFYPYFWSKSKTGSTELFFQTLPEQLKKLHPTSYIAWLSLGLRELWSRREGIMSDVKNRNIVLFETYLRFQDFIVIFNISLFYVLRVLRYRLAMERKIKEHYQGYDITNIIVDEFSRCLIDAELMNCILIMKACNRMVMQEKANALIYRVEFQPHERALIYGARDYCTTIAFQHQALARNHLQYFFPKDEITSYYKDRNNPYNLPLADHYLLAGEYPFEVLKQSGFPEEALDICGPVRYSRLVEYLKTKRTKNETRKKYGYDEKEKLFLVASPVTKEDVFSLMFSLSQAISGIEEQALFLFKSHPVVKYDDDIVRIINETASNMKYEILSDDINLNDYLLLSDALILTGTTVGIEAICLGVVPILFENNSSFSLNPLLEIRDSCLCTRNATELKKAILSVMNDDGEVRSVRKNWPGAIKKLFYRIDEDPNKRFIGILEQKGIVAVH